MIVISAAEKVKSAAKKYEEKQKRRDML